MKLFVFFLVGKMAQTPKSFPKMPRIFLPQKNGLEEKTIQMHHRCTIFLLHILSPRTVHFVSLLQFVHEPWASPHQLATKPPKSCKSARPSLLPHPKQNDGAVSAHVFTGTARTSQLAKCGFLIAPHDSSEFFSKSILHHQLVNQISPDLV